MVQQDAAKKCPPAKEQEADANSSSSLCGQPRPAQARRRSWRQRAQASARQPGKAIRLNRVPLLRAETGSPGTASRGLPGQLSQAVVPVSSSGGGGSFPCQKQSLKGRHAEGAAEPHTSKSLVAKCRRAEDVPDLGTETGTPSTANRGLPGLSPGVVLVGSSGGGGSSSGGFPCQRQSLKRRYPEGAAEPQAPESPAAKRRRIQDVPAQSAETGNSSSARRGVLRLAQDTQAPSRQAAPLWLFPGSRTDNRSQPGPIQADANSSSSLCGQPRPAQARRRSWRQRAQASARQPGKPIRLNRVPLLRAETGSPGTASRGLPGLSQAVVPVSSSGGGGSFPCQKQSLKGRHAEGAAEPHTSKSLVAKCRRAEDVPDLGTETGTPSTASRGLPGLSPGVVLVGSSGGEGSSSSGGFPCQRQSLKPRYPEGAAEPQAPESPAAKCRRIQDAPAQSAETGNSSSARRGVLRLAQDTQAPSRQAAPLWLFPGSRTDNRSQPGPIPMRHVWRQQRQAKKPYSRPENLSRARQTSAPGVFPVTPRNKVFCWFELGDPMFLFPVILQPPAAAVSEQGPQFRLTLQHVCALKDSAWPMATLGVRRSAGLEMPALLLLSHQPGKMQNAAKGAWQFCQHSWLRQPQWEDAALPAAGPQEGKPWMQSRIIPLPAQPSPGLVPSTTAAIGVARSRLDSGIAQLMLER
ncbi:hypothetical protein DUI87_08607 [Hirundo rustica rustica]|uniref:Uncharacterized protein n=1 Tax=Hirundo rustica rustica TaxID=333673 RepID=A0A3M0KLN6_HIRRU|nr:hypothetical protein DUI87_08607 [Hirundo rustica rustica]